MKRVELEPLPVGGGEEPDQRPRGAFQHVGSRDGEPLPEDLELATFEAPLPVPGRLSAKDHDRLLCADGRRWRRDGAPSGGIL
jgi:hypothetical protein